MKSFNEFLFLCKESSIYNAFYYMIYKVYLFYKNLPVTLKIKNRRKTRLEKIYSALLILNNRIIKVEDKRLIEIKKDNGIFFIRPYSSDIDVYNQIIEYEGYRVVVEMYNQLFNTPPKLIIDCGSNIGLSMVYFTQIFPASTLLGFEPVKDNYDIALINLEANNIKNYKLIEGGVWNENTSLSLNNEFRDGKQWSYKLEKSDIINNSIKAFSILEIINNTRNIIDILKIDIEGGERILFSDIEYVKIFLSKVRCLTIEIHDEFNSRDTIYNALNKCNFIYYNTNDLTIAFNRNYI